MLSDLRSIVTPKGGPNFLVALVLCCYTEYWGKLVTYNKLGSRESFEAFFVRLGSCYDSLVKAYGKKIYQNVRCELVHAYAIEPNATVNMGHGTCGVEYDGKTDKYTFNIRTYLDDFERAANQYVAYLGSTPVELNRIEKALKDKPIVV